MLNTVLNLLFPARCVLCPALVTQWRDGAICAGCAERIAPQGPPVCPRCGYPAPSIEGWCSACLKGETQYDFGRAAAAFDDQLRLLVHHFKYNDRVSLARPLGRALRSCLAREAFAPDFVVPVPLHPRRRRQRGYNQADLLARQLGLPVRDRIVGRGRNTESQTGMTRRQRLLNVRTAFESLARIQGCALIVDDVQTTGATVNELARVLKGSGARRVEVLTLARVGSSDAMGTADAKDALKPRPGALS